jgi:hypothetical protein
MRPFVIRALLEVRLRPITTMQKRVAELWHLVESGPVCSSHGLLELLSFALRPKLSLQTACA